MKKLIVAQALIFCFAALGFAEGPAYEFSKEGGLTYAFDITGNISYQSAGLASQDFNVEAKGLLSLDLMGRNEGIYKVKLTPSKTFVKLNEMVLEDFTSEEQAASQLVSSAIIEIKESGEIISSHEVVPGILNLSQMLRLMPVFPEKVRSGKRWKQSLSSLSLPGAPICNLEFNYLYTEGREKGDSSKIRLVANQSIKEKKTEEGMTVNFTGRNSSSGEFAFNREKGEIEKFEGKFGLVLNIMFAAPAGPEKDVSTKQSVPLNMDINLNMNLDKI